jgi:hypothetical protein
MGNDARLSMTNCQIINNASVNNGGAFYQYEAAGGGHTFINCVFAGNSAQSNGGAFRGYSGNTTFDNCFFKDNRAVYGGAIYYGIMNTGLSFSNCIFINNSADYGGAINYYGGGSIDEDSYITNCIFINNSASVGSSIYEYFPESTGNLLTIQNSIFSYNNTGELFYLENVGIENISISCTDIYGNDGGDWTGLISVFADSNGNFSLNPDFCDTANGDFTISSISPCAPDYNAECGLIGVYGVNCIGKYKYLPGDANIINGQWPPEVIGSDVTYLVNYLRGINEPCLMGSFYCAGDANGDCRVIGSDVTRLVAYFRDMAAISYCADYLPAWLSADDCPEVIPDEWPGCK